MNYKVIVLSLSACVLSHSVFAQVYISSDVSGGQVINNANTY